MWVLRLNDMRVSNIEILKNVCRANTKEELQSFLDRYRVESYITNGKWRKVYKEGSVLEWFNPPFQDHYSFVDFGTLEENIQRVTENWNTFCESVKDVNDL